jgi:hypothetical protein
MYFYYDIPHLFYINTGRVSIKIEVWVVANGTTISEASAASIFSVS